MRAQRPANPRTQSQGFTLIELLVVIAIIAILALSNLCRWAMIESPSKLILVGDGHSDVNNTYPQDRWWIWREVGDNRAPGFNRVTQGDKGALRHSQRSNYGFADGHAELMDARRIPCTTNECWWSARADPH